MKGVKMEQYLIGIDNGGSDIKCAVFDLKGNELAVANTQVLLDIPHPGYTERDVQKVWQANVEVIKNALKKAEISGNSVAAVGLTGYGNGMVLIDENFQPVYPVIVSTDDRASDYCQKFKEDGTERKLFPYTLQTTWSAQPAVLLPWFREHNPEVLDKTRWILSMKDFVRLRLTGEVAGEITDASSGCLVNLDTRDYDAHLFEILNIEDCYKKMPPILESTRVSGYITEEAAKETGLAVGIPVAAGYFDIDANALASGILSEDELCLIAGTWSINEYLSANAPKDIAHKQNTVTLSYLKKYYIMEDSTPTSASNFNWFIKTLLRPDRMDIPISQIYEECNQLVESIKPDDSWTIFVPYLFGSATHPEAHGAFMNLSNEDDRGTMLRAVYEGVVFSSTHHIYNLKRPIKSYTKARLSGGVSNSEVWSQMMSDVLQIPIETLEGEEPGAKGAAMGAGIACGIFTDLGDAVEHMVHIGKAYFPRPEYGAVYAKKYKRYEAALQAVDLLAEQI
jgi:L-xylulokinase